MLNRGLGSPLNYYKSINYRWLPTEMWFEILKHLDFYDQIQMLDYSPECNKALEMFPDFRFYKRLKDDHCNELFTCMLRNEFKFKPGFEFEILLHYKLVVLYSGYNTMPYQNKKANTFTVKLNESNTNKLYAIPNWLTKQAVDLLKTAKSLGYYKIQLKSPKYANSSRRRRRADLILKKHFYTDGKYDTKIKTNIVNINAFGRKKTTIDITKKYKTHTDPRKYYYNYNKPKGVELMDFFG